MSFYLDLYVTSSDPRSLDKSLTGVASGVPIIPTGAVDIIAPTLILNYSAAYIQANYCYCSELNRYYFIDNMTLEVGRRMILSCKVDVLKTYAAAIRQCTATVIRNGGIGRPTYIPDNKLPISPSEVNITSVEYPNSPFDTSADTPYVLTVLRGTSRTPPTNTRSEDNGS